MYLKSCECVPVGEDGYDNEAIVVDNVEDEEVLAGPNQKLWEEDVDSDYLNYCAIDAGDQHLRLRMNLLGLGVCIQQDFLDPGRA